MTVRLRKICILIVIIFSIAIANAGFVVSPASAVGSESALVGMPFQGNWASGSLTTAVCGPASWQTSHPSCHEIYSGDWSTDLYQAPDTDVRLKISSTTGTPTFEWMASTGSCGESRRVKIKVDGADVGWIYFTHLTGAASTGNSPTNDMVIGRIANLPCNPGGSSKKHIHIEAKNTAGNYACYFNHSTQSHTAGHELGTGVSIGTIGSTNTGTKQACAEVPGGDTDFDTIPDSQDSCPTVAGEATYKGCPRPIESSPMTVHNGMLHIFGRGQDHEFYDKVWNGNSWNSLHRISPGAVFEDGPVALNYANNLHLIGRGADNEFYKLMSSGNGWSGVERLQPGALFTGEPVAINHYSMLHIFGRGLDGEYYDKVWNGTSWNALHRLQEGAVFKGEPTVVSFDEKVYVFGRGLNDEVFLNKLDGNTWTGFQPLHAGAVFAENPVVVSFGSDLHVIARAHDNEIWKNTLSGGNWSGFVREFPGSVFEGKASVATLNGKLYIVSRGTNHELYANTWSNGVWSGFQAIAPGAGSVFEDDPVATGYGTDLHVVARGLDHELYKFTLTSSGWSSAERLEAGAVFEG